MDRAFGMVAKVVFWPPSAPVHAQININQTLAQQIFIVYYMTHTTLAVEYTLGNRPGIYSLYPHRAES